MAEMQKVPRYLKEIQGVRPAMFDGLGYKTAFIGKVGDDYFGRMLGGNNQRNRHIGQRVNLQ